jgi:catalase
MTVQVSKERPMTQATELIDALNSTFGRHEGYRASHAKGFAVAGRFVPTKEAGPIDIPLLRAPQNVSARFSVGGGKPGISDKSPTVRGIGLELGDGPERWSLALISAPVFFANSASQFREFLAARVPDRKLGGPNPEIVQAFNAQNPNTVPHQQFLKTTAPCRSYASEFYHSGHAYGFKIGDERVSARIELEPENGRVGLTETEMGRLGDNFLQDTLRAELLEGPVRWRLQLVKANPNDEINDPTVPWAGPNLRISLGTIEINAEDSSSSGQTRVFDPSHMPLGVYPPEDRIFDLRSPAYAVSKGRRA